MAKTTIKCDVEGCDYTITHENDVVAKRVMGVHKRKTHGIPGKKSHYIKVKDRLPHPMVISQPSNSPPPETEYKKIVVICPHCSTLIKIETAKL